VCTVIRDRYLQRIPPGYADKKKEENHGNPYGDAIAWFQMLEFAKDNCVKSLIFVTSDCNKEDWFYHDFEDKPVGPRAELVAEMRDFAGCEFHLYRSDIFLQAATDHLNASISEATMKETLQSVSVGPDDEIQDCSPVERMTIEEAQALFLKAIQDDKNKIVEASKAIEELCEAPQRAANKFLEANEKTARAIQQAGEIVVRQADEVAKVLKSIHKASSS
jgi:hypothetical protein